MKMSWKTVKLGEVCEFIYGSSLPDKLRVPGTVEVYGSGGQVGVHNKILVNEQTIVIGRKGSVGSIYLTTGPSWPIDTTYYINQNSFDIKFLYYQLRTLGLNRLDKSTTIPGLNRNDAYQKNVIIPPLSEQKRIAAILDQADELRQKDRQLLQHYDQLIQSTFLGMFGDPVSNPMGWEVKPLEELGTISSGITKNSKSSIEGLLEVPYMRVANVQDSKLDLQEIKTIHATVDEIERYKLKKGDILLTEGGDPDKLGRGAVWNDEIENCIHQNHIFKVRLSPDYNANYFSRLIGSTYGKSYFLRMAKQTTGIATINSSQLKKFPALVPSIYLQNQFAEIVTEIEKQKEIVQQQLEFSEALFQSLLSKAFAGEV